MRKQQMTLAQLIMLHHAKPMHIYCANASDYQINDLALNVFSLDPKIGATKLTHCSGAPVNGTYSYRLSFGDDCDEEYYSLDGDSNAIFATLCEMLVEIAYMKRGGNVKPDNEFIQEMLSECQIIDTTEITMPYSETHIIWKNGDEERTLVSFKDTIDIPYECVEQRKVDADGTARPWGFNENELTDRVGSICPLSQIYVRYLPKIGGGDPIDVPLRVDGSAMPILIYDYVLLLGTLDPSQHEVILPEESEDKPEVKKPIRRGKRKDTFDI